MAMAPQTDQQVAARPKHGDLAATAISRQRLLADKAARWLVAGGGVAIIAAILGILVFILVEVWPLTQGARIDAESIAPAGTPSGALLIDEYLSRAVTLSQDGEIHVLDLGTGETISRHRLAPPPVDDAASAAASAAIETPALPILDGAGVVPGQPSLFVTSADGRLGVQPVAFRAVFDESGGRRIEVDLESPVWSVLDPAGVPVRRVAVATQGSEAISAVAERADGVLALVRRTIDENDFTGESTVSEERYSLDAEGRSISSLALSSTGSMVFAGTAQGDVLFWSGAAEAPRVVNAGSSAVTALAPLFGDRAIVVGQESGALSIWFPLREDDTGPLSLVRVRDFPSHDAAIARILASQRDKGFFVLDREGGAGLYYSTSERTLWRGRSPIAEPVAATISPRADALVFAGRDGALAALRVDNPHPEISPRALFGKVWYEGYQAPDYIWQSSSGTDDFEPKLSLTPLLLGTLKGTLYSLVLAIPLGVFGAMYASQFMHPNLRNYVKPTVEIMAALPSVVLGFLAGLWLAPRIERFFPALLLMIVVLPSLVLITGLVWRVLPAALRNRLPDGVEVLPYGIALALGIWLCLALSPIVEAQFFGGAFPLWINELTGIPYDQRNAIVVGLTMGFAVIPIIFSVAEDAFSNVPRTLISGSLALGATRWQTVTQIVLPTASPGIFSAIMIGFGRAVGETMIVLMATGNTPVMSWFPFNGFRTLSANIAVEIPEAPHGGTLYRTLFLAGLLLFALTFVINTVAELVRQRLRNKFANL